jgi:radical SAM superfamily enzyme YgiQ (UPF0313 family)
MKILFIYSNIDVRGANVGPYPEMQLGLASISAVLKKHGHTCDLLVITENNQTRDVDEKIKGFTPDIVAYTSVTTQFSYIKSISNHIRNMHPELFQICGGPHVTLLPETSLADSGFDAVCVGEGEYAMSELVEKLSRKEDCFGVKSLYFKNKDGRISKNEIRPFNEDLDSLPFFDRELYKDYMDLEEYPHSVLTTRGCYFQCSYCCNHAFKKLAAGKYVRSRTVESIMAEINQLQDTLPNLRHLYIEDETIGLNRRLWDELLPKFKSTGLLFSTNYRIGVTGLDFLDALRDANFNKINIGIESGNEWIRKKILKRKYTNQQIIDTFRHAKKRGMITKSYNLIGLPHEIPEMFEDTIKINRIVHPDQTVLNIFYPYPGTELDKMCDQLGLKPKNNLTPIRERTQSILELPSFPKEKIMSYFNAWGLIMRFGKPGYYLTPLKQVKSLLQKRLS